MRFQFCSGDCGYGFGLPVQWSSLLVVGAVGTPRDKEVYQFGATAAFHPTKHCLIRHQTGINISS